MKGRALLLCVLSGCASHSGEPDEAPEAVRKAATPAVAEVETEPEDAELDAARARSDISRDEEVRLFPSFASVDAKGRVRARIEGWIYEPEEESALRRTFIASIQRGLGEGDYELQAGTAVERVRPFIFDNERGERVEVRLRGEVVSGSVSGQNGRFYIPVDVVPSEGVDGDEWTVRAITRKGDERQFSAPVYPLADEGLLVISDIDDTIKISEVTDKAALLRRSFLEPFEVVPGMAGAYTRWLEAAPRGGHLHFVSSSPWQLFGPLDEMVRRAEFPRASYSLKNFRVDVVDAVDLLAAPDEFKTRAIEDALERLPKWSVILVGDSGERDPEIYGALARKYPERVQKVFIRNVTGHAAEDPRFVEAFAEVSAERWQLFADSKELPEKL